MGLKTTVIRDDRFLDHFTGLTHPESPRRLEAIDRMLEAEFGSGIKYLTARSATLEQVEAVHTPRYIEQILATSQRPSSNLAVDTTAGPKSYLAAFLAAGACVQGVDLLMSGRTEACFAMVRPPGHHALADRAGGFCLFNNLGIATAYALKNHHLNRILIIDWDVHHGNAIQDLFYDSTRVLYFSTHNPHLYPHTGSLEEAGTGAGQGYNINVPLPKGLEDEAMIHLYREILAPTIRNFKPEMIMIAAGYDAHRADPIGRMKLTSRCYFHLTRLILNLADEVGHPPVLLALEGGYDARSLAKCVRWTLKGLLDWRPKSRVPVPITGQGMELAEQARQIHNAYGIWAGCPI